MTICRHCGAQVRQGKAFCFNCGASMSTNAVETIKGPPLPEFADTLSTRDPNEDSEQPATVSANEQLHAARSETSPPELVNDATMSASPRRGFLSGRVWIVIVLLLLLVLGVFAWAILSD